MLIREQGIGVSVQVFIQFFILFFVGLWSLPAFSISKDSSNFESNKCMSALHRVSESQVRVKQYVESMRGKLAQRIELPQRNIQVLDRWIQFPEFVYQAPGPEALSEEKWGTMSERKLFRNNELEFFTEITNLTLDAKPVKDGGHYWASGGLQHVFRDPTHEGRLIKIYDWRKPDTSHFEIANAIRRQIGLENFVEDLFSDMDNVIVVKSDRQNELNQQLLSKGVNIVDFVDGEPVGNFTKFYEFGEDPLVDSIISRLSIYDRAIVDAMSREMNTDMGYRRPIRTQDLSRVTAIEGIEYFENYDGYLYQIQDTILPNGEPFRFSIIPTGIDIRPPYDNLYRGKDGKIYIIDL